MSLFEIGATLGVPGFTLAGFIWLMHHFDVPKPPMKWRGPVIIAYLALIGAVTFYALGRFVPQPSDIEVAVIVQMPDGQPIDDADIQTVPQGIVRAGDGSYVVTFSSAAKLGQVQFNAQITVDGRAFRGGTTVNIAELDGQALEIQVEPGNALLVSGYVRDDTGRALPGAKVSTVGKSTRANEDGWFELIFDSSVADEVRLHIDAEGYSSQEMYAATGDTDVPITMRP